MSSLCVPPVMVVLLVAALPTPLTSSRVTSSNVVPSVIRSPREAEKAKRPRSVWFVRFRMPVVPRSTNKLLLLAFQVSAAVRFSVPYTVQFMFWSQLATMEPLVLPTVSVEPSPTETVVRWNLVKF